MRHNMKIIWRIGNYDVSKFYLSGFDEKLYNFDDDINDLAYFHRDILNQ